MCFSDSFIWREQAGLWGGWPTGGCRWRQHIERGTEGNNVLPFLLHVYAGIYHLVELVQFEVFVHSPPLPQTKTKITGSTYTKNNPQQQPTKCSIKWDKSELFDVNAFSLQPVLLCACMGKGKRVFAEIHSNYCTKIDSSHTLVWDG